MTIISIIIATYNRADYIGQMLDSLLNQKMEGDFDYELIIVDNNSSDRTKDIIFSYEDKFNNKLRYQFESKQGKSFALNAGIKNSKGDIVILTDDDVVLDPLWLTNIWRCFNEYGCDGLGGRILPLYPKNTPKWIKENNDLITGALVIYDYGDKNIEYKKPMYEFMGANLAFKRAVFDECGLFRTDIGAGVASQGEDTEFICRMLKKGKILYYCGQATVWHPADKLRMSLKYISQWNIKLGRYRFIVDEKGKIEDGLVCHFGIPRYLIFKIIATGFSLLIKIFNRREFLKAWIKLSLMLGTVTEIRKRKQCVQSA